MQKLNYLKLQDVLTYKNGTEQVYLLLQVYNFVTIAYIDSENGKETAVTDFFFYFWFS